MRKIVGFVFAAALFGAGVYLLYVQLFVSHTIIGLLLVGTLLALVGAGWLWSDFIGPLFGRGGQF
jgi:hypothetical protein